MINISRFHSITGILPITTSTVTGTEIMIAQTLFSVSPPLFTVMVLHEEYVQALVFT